MSKRDYTGEVWVCSVIGCGEIKPPTENEKWMYREDLKKWFHRHDGFSCEWYAAMLKEKESCQTSGTSSSSSPSQPSSSESSDSSSGTLSGGTSAVTNTELARENQELRAEVKRLNELLCQCKYDGNLTKLTVVQ